jgi:hypothetical protein
VLKYILHILNHHDPTQNVIHHVLVLQVISSSLTGDLFTGYVLFIDTGNVHWNKVCLVEQSCIWKENEKPNLYTIIIHKCYFAAPPTYRLSHLAVVITSIICTSCRCILLLLRRLLSLLRRRGLRIVGLVSRRRCRRSRRLGTA